VTKEKDVTIPHPGEAVKTTNTYPEHEKLAKVKDRSQACGEFLEWLTSEGGFVLCKYVKDRVFPVPASVSIADLLARFFKIDQKKIEDEKRAMLAELQK
jgi:hypothetical protein